MPRKTSQPLRLSSHNCNDIFSAVLENFGALEVGDFSSDGRDASDDDGDNDDEEEEGEEEQDDDDQDKANTQCENTQSIDGGTYHGREETTSTREDHFKVSPYSTDQSDNLCHPLAGPSTDNPPPMPAPAETSSQETKHSRRYWTVFRPSGSYHSGPHYSTPPVPFAPPQRNQRNTPRPDPYRHYLPVTYGATHSPLPTHGTPAATAMSSLPPPTRPLSSFLPPARSTPMSRFAPPTHSTSMASSTPPPIRSSPSTMPTHRLPQVTSALSAFTAGPSLPQHNAQHQAQPSPPQPKKNGYVRRADKGPRPPSKKYPSRPHKQKVFYPVDLLPFGISGTFEVHEIAKQAGGGRGKKEARPCPMCGKSFATEHRLKDHLESSVHRENAVGWGGGGGQGARKKRKGGNGKGGAT